MLQKILFVSGMSFRSKSGSVFSGDPACFPKHQLFYFCWFSNVFLFFGPELLLICVLRPGCVPSNLEWCFERMKIFCDKSERLSTFSCTEVALGSGKVRKCSFTSPKAKNFSVCLRNFSHFPKSGSFLTRGSASLSMVYGSCQVGNEAVSGKVRMLIIVI